MDNEITVLNDGEQWCSSFDNEHYLVSDKVLEDLDCMTRIEIQSGEGCVKLVSIKPINPLAFAEDVIEDMLLQITEFPSDKEFEKYKEAIESRKGEIVERVRELLPDYLSDCIAEMQQQVASDLLNKITEIVS